MFDYSKLRGRIREVFGSEEKFAKALGITAASLSSKFSGKSYFKQAQISKSCALLNIPMRDIGQYFFCPAS